MTHDEMYYKAIIYTKPKLKFEVIEISDEEARGCTTTCYSFWEDGKSGECAIRDTKEKAQLALEKCLIDKIQKANETIKEQEKLLKIIRG